jgi:hypothetical protein
LPLPLAIDAPARTYAGQAEAWEGLMADHDSNATQKDGGAGVDAANDTGRRPGELTEGGRFMPDPSNTEMVGTDPVVRSDIGPDFSTDIGGLAGTTVSPTGGVDTTAPQVNPLEPSTSDDLDRNPEIGLDNTRANF